MDVVYIAVSEIDRRTSPAEHTSNITHSPGTETIKPEMTSPGNLTA